MSSADTSSWSTDAPTTPTHSVGERPPSIGELFANITAQMSTLVRGEIELTKMRAAATAKRLGAGAGVLAVAGVLALFLLGWILHTVEVALTLVLPAWAASLIVVAILLVVVLVLVAVGVAQLKSARTNAPNPSESVSRTVGAVKKGLGHE